MPDVNQIYQSQFLRAEQLGGKPRCVTIEGATVELIGQGERATQKIIVKFAGLRPRLPLNKANALSLASLFGPRTEAWHGKQVELRPERVLFQGAMVAAIRVHAAPAAPTPAASVPAPAVTPPADAGDAWEPDAADVDRDITDDIPWAQ